MSVDDVIGITSGAVTVIEQLKSLTIDRNKVDMAANLHLGLESRDLHAMSIANDDTIHP